MDDGRAIKEIFADYNFALVASRSHMQAKAGKAPRPKFHIYFQINEVTDKDIYVAMKEVLCNEYKFLMIMPRMRQGSSLEIQMHKLFSMIHG